MKRFATGICVIGVDYSLSPEARFPVALEQVVIVQREAMRMLGHAAEVGGGERNGNRCARLRTVSTVVPDIHVIHRLLTLFFAFATRVRGAWCSGDRDGGPGLAERPARARRCGR